jgi:hypothetical protein
VTGVQIQTRHLAEQVSSSLVAHQVEKKFLVQRDRVIIFFNDIPEAFNRLQDVLLVMCAQGLTQES